MTKFIKKHKILTVVIVLAVIAGAYFALKPKDESASMDTATVTRGNITTYNSFVGNVAASSDRKVVSLASEQVVEVLVEKGDRVHEGDVLVRLETENIEYNIKKAGVSLNQAQKSAAYQIESVEDQYDNYMQYLDEGVNTTYNQAKMNRANARTAYHNAVDAYTKLKNSIDIIERGENPHSTDSAISGLYTQYVYKYYISPTMYEEYGTNTDISQRYEYLDLKKTLIDSYCDAIDSTERAYSLADDALAAVKIQIDQQIESLKLAVDTTKNAADLSTSQMDYKKLKDSLEDYTITAPCDGVVTTLVPKQGDMVSAGMTVAVISDLDEMEVDISVDEYSIINTTAGSKVSVYIDAVDRTYDGVLSWVSDVATVAGGVSYYDAKVQFTPDEYVKSGMSVEVKLVRINETDILTLPVDAVSYNDDNTAYVQVKGEKGLENKPVSLGVSDGKLVQVTSGLSENDTVYYTPKFKFTVDMMKEF